MKKKPIGISIEGDEKEGKGIKILTPKKLLTRLSTLLAQIKTENNSNKLKNEIRQKLSFINKIKSLKLFTTILSSHYNNGRQHGCNKTTQNFLFLS